MPAPKILSVKDPTQPLTLIGLMSGTSVDAIDACCVRLWQDKQQGFQYDILGTYTQPMPTHIRTRLLNCMKNEPVSLKELCSLDSAVGALFANAAYGLMAETHLKAEQIDALASHGQTVFHNPPLGEGMTGQTLQIGNGALLAEHTGIPVVYDFRSRDMAVGGQGAPLVCFADQLLFQQATLNRCIQNIGGIANVTVVPSIEGTLSVIAFDTGPGNMLIDGAVSRFCNQPFDRDGAIAATGCLHSALFDHLLSHPYLKEEPPKTTGRELFGHAYLEELLLLYPNISTADLIHTLTRFTAESIANAYEQFVFPTYTIEEVIVGGGGTFNPTLMRMLKERLGKIQIKTHQDFGIPDQYKEALAFAILGWSTLHGIANNIPSCTGANRPAVLGSIIV